ncbi:MAG: T9SS type A sorting domain-containing protein [Chitinophagales bacterium]|nr:T9SS type A sorting domain-containing protein [Chitinophagales bacterium]MDW8418121.1 T9SS type A sorting domain-containing protein [Chitinophagales bacterium]
MKKTSLAILLFCLIPLCHFASEETFTRLLEVNKEWIKQPDAERYWRSFSGQPRNFTEWITAHLTLVEMTLRNRSTATLTEAQKQNRLRLLDELRGYYKAGIYPINDYLPYKNPIFIDRRGTHCAVGYLMLRSGYGELAKRIDANEKFAYVHQIKTRGVEAWAYIHGFTVDELAWIQPAYPASMPTYDLDGGLNGVVNVVTVDPANGTVWVGGSFTASTSGVPCNNIGKWVNGSTGWSWESVNGGVNGTVHALLYHNNLLYVGGQFTQAGGVNVSNVAVYNPANGQWSPLGQLDNTVLTLAVYQGNIYAGGRFTGLLAKWDGTNWINVSQGFLTGAEVRTLEVWSNLLTIGGNFELNTGVPRFHVAVYNGSAMSSLGLGTLTPVNDLQTYRGKLYAACDSASVCAIARFDDGDWVVHLKNDTTPVWQAAFHGNSVKALLAVDSTLYIAGDFAYNVGMGIGYYGGHLMKFNDVLHNGTFPEYNVYGPMLMLDAPVNCLATSAEGMLFGGLFIDQQMAFGENNLNHIGKVFGDSYSAISDAHKVRSISVFPNPANNQINVLMPGKVKHALLHITDLQGREVERYEVLTSNTFVDVTHLTNGTYLLRLATDSGVYTTRFLKIE